MSTRTGAARPSPSLGSAFSIDVAILTTRRKTLAVCCRGAGGAAGAIPWDTARSGETLEAGARRIARSATAAEPVWIEQVGAFADGTTHPGTTVLSVGFVSVVPSTMVVDPAAWVDVRRASCLSDRHREIVRASVNSVRARLNHAPIAFRLLAPAFTLSDLQTVYELLMGRRLHKASFRRALQSAWLVEPTSEWHAEGRGRPARLYRYAPRRGTTRRSARFDLRGG